MKKLLTIFLLLLILILPSCSSGYKIEEKGPYDTHVIGNHTYDFDKKDKTRTEFFVAKTKTFTFNGIEYELNYESLHKSIYYQNSTRYYSGDGISVRFNTATGKAVYVFLSNQKIEIGEATKSEAECKEIAYNFLNTHINDISDYTFENITNTYSNKSIYEFKFTRIIGDLETTDYATIEISFNGEIIGYSFNMLGELKGKSISEDELQRIDNAVFEKMEKIYECELDNYNISHSISSRTLSRLSSGKYIIIYKMETQFKRLPNTHGYEDNDPTSLIVYI